jgi:hypothetical protein
MIGAKLKGAWIIDVTDESMFIGSADGRIQTW